MTSTGSLKLSRAPFLRRSLLSVIWPERWGECARRVLHGRNRTLSYAIVDLVHVQVLDIRGENAVEQLG